MLLFLSYFYDYQGHIKYRLEWYLFSLFILVLIGGLRYRLGIDTIAYEAEYESMPTLTNFNTFDFENSRYGRAWILFVAVARSISDNFVVLQFMQAFLVNSIIFWFFYKYTKHIFIAVTLYFIITYVNFTFEAMRESCAIGVFLLGYKHFLSENWFKFYLFGIVAALFHPSALIVGLLPLFYMPFFRKFFRLGFPQVLMLCIIFLVAGMVSIYFFDVLRLLEVSTIEDYASKYEYSRYAESSSLNIKGTISFILKYILNLSVALYIIKKKKNIPKYLDINKLEYMFCWSLYIAVAMLFIRLFYRFNNYFYPFSILILSEGLYDEIRFKGKIIRLSFTCWILLLSPCIAAYTYSYFTEDGGSGYGNFRRYYPYSSILIPTEDTKRENLYKWYGR